MKAWHLLSGLLVAVTLTIASTPSEARRVALVIGNSAYKHVPELKNPRNDARDIADTLRSIGFEDVSLTEDLDYREMRLALRRFAQRSRGAEHTLIFYAGHSVEVDKKNYLVPIDAKLNNVVDVDFEAIALDQVRTAASSASKLKMIILDACRNNPFNLARQSTTRSLGRGLAIVEAKPDELIAYAAREGTTAQDGQYTRNSPFTTALLKNLRTPGLEVGVIFRKVRDDVLAATSNRQEPYTYASLRGVPIYLNGKPAIVLPPSAPRPAYRPPPPLNTTLQEAATAWAATKDTRSIAVLSAFKRRYTGTVYADMAAAKIEEIQNDRRTNINRPNSPSSDQSQTPGAAHLTGTPSYRDNDTPEYRTIEDSSSGVSFSIPNSISLTRKRTKYGYNYSTGPNGINFDTLLFRERRCPGSVLQRIKRNKDEQPEHFRYNKRSGLIYGSNLDQWYWVRLEKIDGSCKGLSIVVSHRSPQLLSIMKHAQASLRLW